MVKIHDAWEGKKIKEEGGGGIKVVKKKRRTEGKEGRRRKW
jgi:hypothetical protein